MESIRVADSRLNDVLNQKQANYIYPFFWIRTGETDKIINELNQIYNSGIRAVCVEGIISERFRASISPAWMSCCHRLFPE